MVTTMAVAKKIKERPLSAVDFNLYLITDRRLTGEKPLIAAAEEAIKGGLRAIQLREKDLGTRELLKLAYDLRKLCLKHDARLFINDRVDIAIAVDADGVHLSRESIPPYAVRRLSRKLIIGSSAHSIAEAEQAEKDGADFITLGPIYPTPSKLNFGRPIGLETLRLVSKHLSIPVFAIGGINLDNLNDALNSGADGVAVVSAILASKNIKAATAKFLRAMQ